MARIFIAGSIQGIGRAAACSLLAQGHEVVLQCAFEATRRYPSHLMEQVGR
jgi:NAD(P)-dependent dehydrogenase (short-subunit alcohol dehydrogenase family)